MLYEFRGEATNPVSFVSELTGRKQLRSPGFPGVLAPQGRQMVARCQNMAKLAVLGGQPGYAFVTISLIQALIHGFDILSGSLHRGSACCQVGSLLFPQGMIT